MRNPTLGLLCAIVGTIAVVPALAQDRLTEAQILQSLATSPGAAEAAHYDINAIQRDIEERIRVEGTTNAADPPPALQALAMLPNVRIEIEFDLNSDWILPSSWPDVGTIADALHNPLLNGYEFAVVGHTDATGTREYNLGLSKRRAAAVRETLVETFLVDSAMLVSAGFGEEQLEDPQNPDSGINRRVQLLNLGPKR